MFSSIPNIFQFSLCTSIDFVIGVSKKFMCLTLVSLILLCLKSLRSVCTKLCLISFICISVKQPFFIPSHTKSPSLYRVT